MKKEKPKHLWWKRTVAGTLAALLIAGGDIGSTVVKAAENGVNQDSGVVREGNIGTTTTVTGGDLGTSTVTGGDIVTIGVQTAENQDSDVIWEGDLGTTAVITGTVAKYWKDGLAPANFTEAWLATAPVEGTFQLSVEEDTEGEYSVHASSSNAAVRYDMFNSKLTGIDYTKEYVLSAYVKTENVSGTGIYMRAQVGTGVNKNLGDGSKVKGSTEGWKLYEISLTDLATVAGDDSGKMKIEIFFEKFTGDIWVKNIALREATEPEVPVEPEVPDVPDEPDLGLNYGAMRAKWTERLTGNSYWAGAATSTRYLDVIGGYETAAAEALSVFVGDSDTRLFSDLDLTLKEGSTTTNANDSEPLNKAILRIQDMARVWASEGSSYYHNEDLKAKILYALEWSQDHFYHAGLDNKARYGNWYHWWISMPQNLTGAAILMYDELNTTANTDLLDGIVKTLAHFNEDPSWVYKVKGAAVKMDMTAANLADTCLVSILRGIVGDDQRSVTRALAYFDDLAAVVTSGEGIYADGSFIQHTNLAYTGGYGATLLNGLEKMVYLTSGSNCAVAEDQLDVVYNWIWNGIRPLYAEGAVFEMVSGRSVARTGRSDLTTGRGVMVPILLLSESAPEAYRGKLLSFIKKQLMAGSAAMGEADYYGKMSPSAMMRAITIVEDDSIAPEGESSFAHIFASMDKAVAHTPSFHMGISYASNRTGRFEYGNNENSQGWHQSDGMMFLYNGDLGQYSDNYWNTIDPQRLPGITTDHSTWPIAAWGSYAGNGTFNGGAVLGAYMAAAMDFQNYATATNPDLQAQKAWFVFDDEIVSLGAGISGINNTNTETIVENKKVTNLNTLLLNGTEYTTNENTDSTEEQVSWAWLAGNGATDSIGYYFPEATDLYVKREVRTGSWQDVNNGNASVDGTQVSRNYVSLSIPHVIANGDSDTTYAYVLLPGMTAADTESYGANADIRILSNTESLQAAGDEGAGAYGYHFWEAGSYTPEADSNAYGLCVSQPASVVVSEQEGTFSIGIADPTQTQSTLTVSVMMDTTDLTIVNQSNGITVDLREGEAVFTVNTAQGAGKTFSVDFTKPYVSIETNEYTVTFQDYDGTPIGEPQTVAHGSDATAPADPTREGYTFTGWDKVFTDITADLVVTAQYTINKYEVVFKDWDGTVINMQTINHGEAADAPQDPSRIGHEFVGWDVTFNNVTKDLVVTAVYQEKLFTVTFVDYDGKELDKQTVAYGKPAESPKKPTRDYYEFVGWDKGFAFITEDITITAQYRMISGMDYVIDKPGTVDGTKLENFGNIIIRSVGVTLVGGNFSSNIRVEAEKAILKDLTIAGNVYLTAKDTTMTDAVIGGSLTVSAESISLRNLKVGGNISIGATNISLVGGEIKGNLTIERTVGNGHVEISDVTAAETIMYVKGGGSNSIVITDSIFSAIVVEKAAEIGGQAVRVAVQGSTEVANLIANSAAIIEDSAVGNGIQNVTLANKIPATSTVELRGAIKAVAVQKEGLTLVNNAKVAKLQVEASALTLVNNAIVSELKVEENVTDTKVEGEKVNNIVLADGAEEPVYVPRPQSNYNSGDDEDMDDSFQTFLPKGADGKANLYGKVSVYEDVLLAGGAKAKARLMPLTEALMKAANEFAKTQDTPNTPFAYVDVVVDGYKSGKATVKFNLYDISENDAILVFHQKTDGTWECIIPDKIENGAVTVTFTSLSPVVFSEVTTGVAGSAKVSSPKTGDGDLNAMAVVCILGICAGLGYLQLTRRKYRR